MNHRPRHGECAKPGVAAQKPVVFPLTRRGFCSELNCLVQFLLFARAHRLSVLVDDTQWNAQGWTHYFKKPEVFRLGSTDGEIRCTLGSALWNEFRFYVTKLFDRDEQLGALTKQLWQLNAATAARVVSAYEDWHLEEGYVAVHVRRGDKLETEACDRPIAEYIHEVKDAIERTLSNTLVVATDDWSAFRDLKSALTGHRVLSRCTDERLGHRQDEFNKLSASDPAKIVDVTRELICDIELLRRSDIFICTLSSNVARLVHNLRRDRTAVISLDQGTL
jgi:hypothetical protein